MYEHDPASPGPETPAPGPAGSPAPGDRAPGAPGTGYATGRTRSGRSVFTRIKQAFAPGASEEKAPVAGLGLGNAAPPVPRPELPGVVTSAPAAQSHRVTAKEATLCANTMMSLVEPTVGTVSELLGVRTWTPEEFARCHEAWKEYALVRGDPFGKWGPEFFLAVAHLGPIISIWGERKKAELDKLKAAA